MNNNTINPSYYKDHWSHGAQVIDISENLNFNRGNVVKYVSRAGKKNSELEDLHKALWYLTREIDRLTEKQKEGNIYYIDEEGNTLVQEPLF